MDIRAIILYNSDMAKGVAGIDMQFMRQYDYL